MAAACGTPLPTGLCQNMLDSLYGNSFPQWYSVGFTGAQAQANNGLPAIAITYDHVAIVRPNDGTVPSEVKYVRITQAGNTLLNDSTIAWGWPADRHSEIKFYSWYD